jgi:hypothetical protein
MLWCNKGALAAPAGPTAGSQHMRAGRVFPRRSNSSRHAWRSVAASSHRWPRALAVRVQAPALSCFPCPGPRWREHSTLPTGRHCTAPHLHEECTLSWFVPGTSNQGLLSLRRVQLPSVTEAARSPTQPRCGASVLGAAKEATEGVHQPRHNAWVAGPAVSHNTDTQPLHTVLAVPVNRQLHCSVQLMPHHVPAFQRRRQWPSPTAACARHKAEDTRVHVVLHLSCV